MSSGPQVALAALVLCSAFYWAPHLIGWALGAIGLAATYLEFASNRHFYHLVDYLALSKITAAYRTRLMEVAVQQVHEYWAVGVGSHHPHHWGRMVDGRALIDVVNHFIVVALESGLPGLAMYIAMHVLAIREGMRAWRVARARPTRALAFGLTALLIAVDMASFSVGLFGAPAQMTYIALGALVGCRQAIVRSQGAPRTRRPAVAPARSIAGPRLVERRA